MNTYSRAVAISFLFGSAGLFACASRTNPDTALSAKPAPSQAPAASIATPPEPAGLRIDAARLRQDVAVFSSDEMEGRFTLSPSLSKASNWLADQYRELGIAGLNGESYEHNYPLHLGVALAKDPVLQFELRGRPGPVKSDRFSAVSVGGPGTVEGEVVFVGYGLQTKASAKGPALDELAGVDLKGKIAVVLAGVPGDMDVKTVVQRAQEIADTFNRKVKSIPAAKEDKVLKLHRKARESMAKELKPYLKKSDIEAGYFEVSAPVKRELDFRELYYPLVGALSLRRKEMAKADTSISLREKLWALKARGAAGVIVVRGPESFLDKKASRSEKLPPLYDEQLRLVPKGIGIPTVYLSHKEAARWLRKSKVSLAGLQKQIDEELVPKSQVIKDLKAKIDLQLDYNTLEVPNVLALIPGSDLADEIVIVGAHYDHIGTSADGMCREQTRSDGSVDSICNGADDNASGTAALLAIARGLMQSSVKPRRSVLFAHFSGEELGLFGSGAFVDDPPVDLNKVVAMINLDMIGRVGAQGLFIGGLATSSQWMPIFDQVGTYGVATTYDAASTTRSDHAHFTRRKIPSVFFFNGVHEDYHQAGDEASRVNYDGLYAVSSVVGGVVETLAGGAAIPWTEPAPGRGLVRSLPGQNEDTVIKRVPAKGAPQAWGGTFGGRRVLGAP